MRTNRKLGSTLVQTSRRGRVNSLPNTGQEDNRAQSKIDKWFSFSLHFSSFLTVYLLFKRPFCSLTKGITLNVLLVLSCLNNWRSFEPFMCLDRGRVGDYTVLTTIMTILT